MKNTALLSIFCLSASVLSAQLVDLQFDDGASVGANFSSSTNAGSIGGSAQSVGASNTVTYAEGRAFSVSPTDLGIAFANTNGQLVQLASFPAQSGDFTFMLSVKLDGTQALLDTLLRFEGSDRSAPGTDFTEFQMASTANVEGNIGDRSLTTPLASGVWTHLALTYDNDGGSGSEGKAILYVNGTEVTSSNFVDNFSINAGQAISLGAQGDGFRPISGTLDNVKVWDSLLSPTEVDNQYQQTLIPEANQSAFVLGLVAVCCITAQRRKR